jgi:hypothetical protein
VLAEQLGDEVDVLRRARNAVDRARHGATHDVADAALIEHLRYRAHDEERISEHELVPRHRGMERLRQEPRDFVDG